MSAKLATDQQASAPWHTDFEAAGYKPYRDRMKDRGDTFYQGSWQKRVKDPRGTRYFLNVDLWDFSGRRSAHAEVQFHERDDMNGEALNFGRNVRSIPEIEAFVANLWGVLGCGYYEVNDPAFPRPVPPLQIRQNQEAR